MTALRSATPVGPGARDNLPGVRGAVRGWPVRERHVSTGFLPGGVTSGASAASVDFRSFDRRLASVLLVLTNAKTTIAPIVPKASTANIVEVSIRLPFQSSFRTGNVPERDSFP